jgi:peptide/nickel transport system ATP-binding protein
MTALAEEPTLPRTRQEALLEVRGLTVEYAAGERPARAVDGVDLAIFEGETVGLAGESGCGKTTIANAVMQLLRPPARIAGGSILFEGEDLVGRSAEELRRFRWRNVSMVLQSAMNALNPVMRVGDQFVDAMRAHEHVDRRRALARAGELLEVVGIDRARVRAYPHELSGGMRQRVVIAMALALHPQLVVMDEPTTALDVVVQKGVLAMIREVQREIGSSLLFVTHDMAVHANLADRLGILYAGRLVEEGRTADLFRAPRHPYTAHLIASLPRLGDTAPKAGLSGTPPNLADPPPGCRFHPRCPRASDLCRREVPPLEPVALGHRLACFHPEPAP